jgi:kynurenine formamidase
MTKLSMDPALTSLITKGNIYEIGQPYYVGMPTRSSHPPFVFSLIRTHQMKPKSGANCIFTMGGHTGTHIDAIGHVSTDGRVYGHKDVDITKRQSFASGVGAGGIEETPPIVTRGVLLDIPKLRKENVLAHDYVITQNDLIETEKAQKVEVKKGDTLLIRTGWIQYYAEGLKYVAQEGGHPGIGLDAADWIAEKGVKYTGSDTTAYEKLDITNLKVHTKLLRMSGIQIMESLNLEELAQDQVYEFLFVCLPLRIVGGTGSPIRPIAVV